ncbi:NAD-dependent epimerase/dehydratase family protein [Tateyamaria armeniaca]|uniref:NAD-dependent epimerase/dehydratase family protein n=1 Tax=Tateyamaria armeniaca TaxID=2518930 RepID=A0ABW8UZP6_9RHOB
MINEVANKRVVWITGAAGFLGQELARQIGAEPGTVCCGLGRGASPQPDMHHVEAGDISVGALDRLLARTGPPDAIYHLAGGSSVGRSLADPMLDFTNSVHSAAVLFQWVSDNAPKARVLVASSAAVYGADYTAPITESSALCPISPYGWHKKMVEDLAVLWHQHSDLDVLPVRIFSLFWTWTSQTIVLGYCGAASHGRARDQTHGQWQ